ncbi:24993_t:CDS:1, partial [Racocetra persica]
SFGQLEQTKLPDTILSGKYSNPLSISVSTMCKTSNLIKFCNGLKEPAKELLEIPNHSKLINLLKGVKLLAKNLLLDKRNSLILL